MWEYNCVKFERISLNCSCQTNEGKQRDHFLALSLVSKDRRRRSLVGVRPDKRRLELLSLGKL